MTLTIPELRMAYEKIMKVISSELSKSMGKVSGALITDVQKAWKENFGKDLETDYAKSLVEYMNGERSRKQSSRKTRRASRASQKQSGGMAPIDYQTRAGIDGVYGKFPTYVGSGFEVGVPQISQATLCGKVDTTPAVTAMVGNNTPLQNGGSKRKRTARRRLGSRKRTTGGANFILSTNPSSVIQDAVRGWNGQIPAASSPSPVDIAFQKYLP